MYCQTQTLTRTGMLSVKEKRLGVLASFQTVI